MNWYLNVLKNYAVIDGRARRTEYWMFFLFNIIAIFILAVIDRIVFEDGYPILQGIYQLAVLVPSFCVSVRRLHDTDKSGWWLLLAFIPLLGAIALVIMYCIPGTSGENKYGPDPIGLPDP